MNFWWVVESWRRCERVGDGREVENLSVGARIQRWRQEARKVGAESRCRVQQKRQQRWQREKMLQRREQNADNARERMPRARREK